MRRWKNASDHVHYDMTALKRKCCCYGLMKGYIISIIKTLAKFGEEE